MFNLINFPHFSYSAPTSIDTTMPPRFLFHLSLFFEMRKENNIIGFRVSSSYSREQRRRRRVFLLFLCSSTNNNKSKIALNEKIAFSFRLYSIALYFRKVFITWDFIYLTISIVKYEYFSSFNVPMEETNFKKLLCVPNKSIAITKIESKKE